MHESAHDFMLTCIDLNDLLECKQNTRGVTAIFEKPEEDKYRHLKPLYVKGFVDGKPMTKMLVDGGAALHLMPYTTFRKIGKSQGDLNKADMMLKDFGGNASQTRGH